MRLVANQLLVALVLAGTVSGRAQQNTEPEGAIRGWLSDEQCARGRAESGVFSATNPQCARECVSKGRKIVLIDPDRKTIFRIDNQSLAQKNVGDYVEIAGQIDTQAKTIRVARLKMLNRGTASCDRPTLSN